MHTIEIEKVGHSPRRAPCSYCGTLTHTRATLVRRVPAEVTDPPKPIVFPLCYQCWAGHTYQVPEGQVPTGGVKEI